MGTDAWHSAQEPGRLLALPLRSESSDPRPVARNQEHQVGVQTVLHPGPLGDELVTVVDEELEILVCSARQRRAGDAHPGPPPGRWQGRRWDRTCPGDPSAAA